MRVIGDVVLKTSALGRDKKWEVVEPITLEYKDYIITIKPGYKTDGASIPRILWDNIGHPMSTKFITAALFHDILYDSEAMPREFSDDLFGDLLDASGVGEIKEWIMEVAVEVFGGATWDKHTATSIEWANSYLTIIAPDHL
jgi:hypothetical protein